MDFDRRRARRTLILTVLLVGGLLRAPSTAAQEDPIGDLLTSTTTSTAPPQPSGSSPRPTSTSTTASSAPAGAVDQGGDGVVPPGQIVVPPEAQRIIDAVRRTPPSNDRELIAGVEQLVALGATQEEADRIALGRFPLAGPARWSDDWLLPRYGPGFRFHLGCDVVAAYGTPVRAPVDGLLTSSTDSLGGLTARVTMSDGTRFAFAHLSRLGDAPPGAPVRTGDVIGFVGDSGNAKGGTPHVHVAIYPKGGPATNPKPILDRFVRDATAALPQVVQAYVASRAGSAVPLLPVPDDARLLRPALSSRLMQHWVSGGDDWSLLQLYVVGTDPGLGADAVLRSSLDALVEAIDWTEVPRR